LLRWFLALTLGGVQAQKIGLMLIGTIMSGAGFGAAFLGKTRMLMPLAQSKSVPVSFGPFMSKAISRSAYSQCSRDA
jgi:hypothetical protein